MPEVTETPETEEAQTRTRSALGGFERDAKTFEGHLQKVLVSADNFVKRCAKFEISNPGHERLAETAELLAEAKRICGKTPAPVAAPESAELSVTHDWRAWDAIRGLTDRVKLLETRLREIDGEDEGELAAVASLAAEVPPSPALAQAYADGAARDPLAGLQPDAAARVQAAIDAATEARKAMEAPAPAPAPTMISPFAAAAPAAMDTNINPFAGLVAK